MSDDPGMAPSSTPLDLAADVQAPEARPRPATDPALLAEVVALGAAIAAALPPALARAQAAAAVREPQGLGAVLRAYARYLALFVGAGLLAGAVVHFPLAPLRHAGLGLAGALLFAAGSATGGEHGARRGARLAASLVLALGVGMVAGGIQHFEDVPGRATVLVPAGLVLGLVAFVARTGLPVDRPTAVRLAGVAVAVAVAIGAALAAVAGGGAGPTGSPAAHDGGHGH